jgi:hypothetical protein
MDDSEDFQQSLLQVSFEKFSLLHIKRVGTYSGGLYLIQHFVTHLVLTFKIAG